MAKHPSTTQTRTMRASSRSSPAPAAADGGARGRRRLERVGAGWKVGSGGVATIATVVGVLSTFGLVGGGGGAPPAAVAVASAAAKAADASSSRVLVTVI